jgi:hypothetical protein
MASDSCHFGGIGVKSVFHLICTYPLFAFLAISAGNRYPYTLPFVRRFLSIPTIIRTVIRYFRFNCLGRPFISHSHGWRLIQNRRGEKVLLDPTTCGWHFTRFARARQFRHIYTRWVSRRDRYRFSASRNQIVEEKLVDEQCRY